MAGSVINHSRDFNLAREASLDAGLSPRTPATSVQMACGTSLQAALMLGAKIATGEIESGIAAGSDTVSDSPVVFGAKFQRRMIELNKARSIGEKFRAFKGFSFGELTPVAPSVNEPRTGLSMGQHCELMAREWGISRRSQDEWAVASHRNAAKAYDEGFHDDLLVPCAGLVRDNNVRADTNLDKLSSLKPAFDKASGKGTLTAGNSTPLTDGASAVLLASEDWARERGLPVLAYLSMGRVAGNDFAHGEGLLMAPTVRCQSCWRGPVSGLTTSIILNCTKRLRRRFCVRCGRGPIRPIARMCWGVMPCWGRSIQPGSTSRVRAWRTAIPLPRQGREYWG